MEENLMISQKSEEMEKDSMGGLISYITETKGFLIKTLLRAMGGALPTRRILTPRGESVEVLSVPWQKQKKNDSYCFPASLHMILRYFNEQYSNPILNESIPDLSYDDVIRMCRSDLSNGTKIDNKLMLDISNELVVLQLDLELGITLDDLKERKDHDLPTIVIYDGKYLKYNLKGPAHSGVYIGSTGNGDPILNNPWFGEAFVVSAGEFNKAWELHYNRAVFVEPKPQSKFEVVGDKVEAVEEHHAGGTA